MVGIAPVCDAAGDYNVVVDFVLSIVHIYYVQSVLTSVNIYIYVTKCTDVY